MRKKYVLLFFVVISAQNVCNDDDIILRFSDVFIPHKVNAEQRFTITVQADGESWVVNEAQCKTEIKDWTELMRQFAIDIGIVDFDDYSESFFHCRPYSFFMLNSCVVHINCEGEVLHVDSCYTKFQKEASLYNLYEKLCAVRDAQQELKNNDALQKTILPGIYLNTSLCCTLLLYLLTNVFV